jgi:uncharacterized membrane protein
MTEPLDLPDAANDFLRRLDWSLAALPRADRDDALAEVRAHFIEARDQGQDLDAVLAGFGPPDIYARDIVECFELTKAVGRAAIWPVMRVLAARVTRSLTTAAIGAAIAVPGLFCLAALISVVAKIIDPPNSGLWLGPHEIAFGTIYTESHTGPELLGAGFIPVMLTLALISALIMRASLLAWARHIALGRHQR